MNRRFVNLVLETCKDSAIPLHRINLSRFFYPKKRNAGAGVAPQPTVEEGSLPKPVISFVGDHENYGGVVEFMPLVRDANKVVGLYDDANVILYDADKNSLCPMPRLNLPKRRSIPLPVGDNLYVIEDAPLPSDPFCFEVLKYGRPLHSMYNELDWYWHPLPPPPYFMVPGYNHGSISSYTVIGESSIWISTTGVGTYSFDRASSAWSKAGSWVLPFQGRAVYAPEHGMWFGFSSADAVFCASDLVSVAARTSEPTLCNLWEEDLAFSEKWKLVTSHLVHVGSGKFCIARFFHVWNHHEELEDRYVTKSLVIITGVEVHRCSSADKGLQLVKHKSVRYSLADRRVGWLSIF